MLLVVRLLACTQEGAFGGKDADPDGVPGTPPPPEPPPIAIEAALAFDPLRGPATVVVVTAPGAEVHLDVAGVVTEGAADGSGRLSVTWDGRDGAAFLPAGLYPIDATATAEGVTAAASAELTAVRPGFLTAWLEDDDGTSATREPLFFPVDRVLQDEADPVALLDALDDGQVALDFPAVPDEVFALRPAGAEPAAFTFDSRPILVLEPGETSQALGATGIDLAPIEVSAAGWTVLSGSPLAAGVPVVLQLDAPLGDTVGVSALDVALSLSAGGAPLGEQQLPLRIFRLLDVSRFEDPGMAYRPWAPVVSQALEGIEGTTAEHGAVADALVAWVYQDLGLTYDTQFGASAYSDYLQFEWDRPHFRLSEFLVRSRGNTINCTDAANILGAYANMVGARIDHLVVDPPFDLNYILAIGGTEFDRCPFGAFGCGFSYHAVTTTPQSSTIWDATLALDGDLDPRTLPATELLVQSIDATEYLDRLVRSGDPTFHDPSQETLE